ncbi:basic proline-rich protein-like [Pseudopipra pipra]|uniref:basic proline-rich protein-like n=1 Tax=Pseudopipra pipra TaxID=415032 RepID=UPI0031391AC3
MAPPGPELSPDHTKDGGERPPCLREASILLPDFRRHPDPRPAPAAPSRRAASRCGDRAGGSAAPGAGRRFVSGGWHRRGQPHIGAAARSLGATTPGRGPPPSAPAPAHAPAPLGPAVPRKCCRGCAADFPPWKRPTAGDPTSGSPGHRPRGDEAYGKKDQRPRGMLFLTPRGKRRCSPGQRQEPSYLRPWLPLSLRLPWMCRTPLAGLTLWLLCPTCCVPAGKKSWECSPSALLAVSLG